MFMLLLSGNRYTPDTFISVRQVYGSVMQNTGLSVVVRSLRGRPSAEGLCLTCPSGLSVERS